MAVDLAVQSPVEVLGLLSYGFHADRGVDAWSKRPLVGGGIKGWYI